MGAFTNDSRLFTYSFPSSCNADAGEQSGGWSRDALSQMPVPQFDSATGWRPTVGKTTSGIDVVTDLDLVVAVVAGLTIALLSALARVALERRPGSRTLHVRRTQGRNFTSDFLRTSSATSLADQHEGDNA